ncbi:ABC transporter permease [Steroidobacter agaridevorans]
MRRLGFVLATSLISAILVALLITSPIWLLLTCLGLFAVWMVLSRAGQQTWSVAQVGIATIPARPGSAAVIVVGIAGVVGVMVALLAMGEGFEATLRQTGTADTAIVLQSGARAETSSTLNHEAVAVAMQAPQVLRNAQNQPIASPELLIVASLPKQDGVNVNVSIRGIGPGAWELRPNAKIIAGRRFEPGLRELLVGQGIRGTVGGIDVGSSLTLSGQSWTVVGIFDSGDAYNSEFWADTPVVASAFRRQTDVTSVVVRLTDPAAFDAFKAGLTSDPRLKIDVTTTQQYYSQQSEGLRKMARTLGLTVGAIMAVGALFGALNSMYAAVAGRARETATLRAIGFRRAPVIVSVLIETMLLAVPGGLLGAAITWAIFDGYTASTRGMNASQIVFAFDVSPMLLLTGLKWALAIGLIGGLFPALRAARMPVATGLREL